MTVYVDDFLVLKGVKGIDSRWSHMIADSQDELHEFAKSIGLKREWFQDPTVNGKPVVKPGCRAAENWHYDVTSSKRTLALKFGAVSVGWLEVPLLIDHRVEHGQCRPAQGDDL
jgi:cell division inhibitor SulA